LQCCLRLVAGQQGRTQQHKLRREAELIAGLLILIQRSLYLVEPAGFIQRADVPDRARQSEPVAESVLLRYGETTLRITLSDFPPAAHSEQNRCVVPGVSVRVRPLYRLGPCKPAVPS